MRATLHILALVVLLPYLALAAGFLIMGHAIASSSLLSFFETLLAHAAWIAEWGMYAAAFALLVLVLLGLTSRFRWVGALCVCILAAGSLLVILLLSTGSFDSGHLLFLLPCVAVLLLSAWLYRAERAPPSRRFVPGGRR